MAQSGSSDSSVFVNGGRLVCDCNRPPRIVKAWTKDNPGRRFYKCGSRGIQCNFFEWVDTEKPHGWQHVALLEARNMMREQKEEIDRLKKQVIEEQSCALCYEVVSEVCNLRRQIGAMRNVIRSLIGFGVVIGITVAYLI